jgi:hypothetical protein
MSDQTLLASLPYRYDEADVNPLIDYRLETSLKTDFSWMNLMPFTFDLGDLRRLPIEHLFSVLEQLPLMSLISFRNTNRLAHHMVSTMPKFRIVIEQAPRAIRDLLAVQTEVETTLLGLLEKLQQRHCDSCGKLSRHLWLPAITSLCFSCTRFGPTKMKKEVTHPHHLSDEDIEHVRTNMPLFVSFFKCRIKGKYLMMLGSDTNFAPQIRHVNPGIKAQLMLPDPCNEHEDNRSLVLRPKQKEPAITPSQPVPQHCHSSMATIIAPQVFDEGADMGSFCRTCLYTTGLDTIYTDAEFFEHLKTCHVQPFDELVQIYRDVPWKEKTNHLKLIPYPADEEC